MTDSRAFVENEERKATLSTVGGGGQADWSRSNDDDGKLCGNASSLAL